MNEITKTINRDKNNMNNISSNNPRTRTGVDLKNETQRIMSNYFDQKGVSVPDNIREKLTKIALQIYFTDEKNKN